MERGEVEVDVRDQQGCRLPRLGLDVRRRPAECSRANIGLGAASEPDVVECTGSVTYGEKDMRDVRQCSEVSLHNIHNRLIPWLI